MYQRLGREIRKPTASAVGRSKQGIESLGDVTGALAAPEFQRVTPFFSSVPAPNRTTIVQGFRSVACHEIECSSTACDFVQRRWRQSGILCQFRNIATIRPKRKL